MDSFVRDHAPMKGKSALFKGWPIISDQISADSLGVIWRELEYVLKSEVPGDVVEFGCYAGTTSLFLRRLLIQYPSEARHLHVYDSFEGLPEKSPQDQSAAGIDFQAGKLFVGKKELLHQFKAANLPPPIVHKAWFDKLAEADVPGTIAFAFLDGDFYGSIMSSLKLVWPKMSPGGSILIDDYQRETLPGVEKAVAEFFHGKQVAFRQVEYNILTIRLTS